MAKLEVDPMEIEGADDEKSPIKQVEMTVPTTDDPSLPVYTFRVWLLGIVACVVLAFVNQFFWYRRNPLSISSILPQIAVVPLGHLMARVVTRRVFLRGRRYEFTLNPGPFNVKEHVLITILANAGAGSEYATHILSAVKLFYNKTLGFIPAFILMMTSQVLGYGFAGIFRKQLVDSAEMWWPSNLVKVSLFRALHEKENRPKGGTTRIQFFLIVLASIFCYTVFPTYFFPMLTSLSWLCWLAPKSVLVQQLGSGQQGLGIGAIGIDWSTISSFLGTPLASPWHASANVLVGYLLVLYVIVPIGYWSNLYDARNFPFFSDSLYQHNGQRYNTSAIINSKFSLDKEAYEKTGPLYLSIFFALTFYGFGFATLSATVVHVLLFNGRELWDQTKMTFKPNRKMDIHERLMKAYQQVPMWWFLAILIVNIGVILFACQYYNDTLQLPWWGVLLACFLSFIYILPIGIISATTNQTPGLNIITEYIFGYLYPGRPVANMCFKVYGYISMVQALTFIEDFKLGHYMKIPPRAMFCAQVVGTVISVIVYVITSWWMMETIPNLCDKAKLPPGSPWICPSDTVFYDASVIWGLIGPQRIFGNLGMYPAINWLFLFGAIAPLLVWLATKAFPKQKWISLIHMPVLLSSTSMMPPASPANYTSWLLVAFLSGYVLYWYWPDWWNKYNYILSGGLDAGTAFTTLLLYFALQGKNIQVDWWGNNPDGCPLASCPTAKGITVEGCPVNS